MERPRTAEDITRHNVELISRIQAVNDRERTPGERIADAVAHVVGSWPFIITQSVLLTGWVVLNVVAWIRHWDPYPFILLNLALSFQAAYASPIIMMSQNRAARLADRRNQLALQINLLTEQEDTEQLHMLRLLCDHAGITLTGRDEQALETSTRPARLLRQIEAMEKHPQKAKKPGP
jgi:uncharacterized membrane protein